MSFSRRQAFRHRIALCAGARFLRANAAWSATAAACSAVAGVPSRAAAVYDATASALVLTQGTRAPVWGVNGRYLGPTIRVWKGDIYSNRPAENVSMTVAGLRGAGR